MLNMNESQPIPAEFLGITEDVYRNVGVSRRTVLQIPVAVALSQLLAACGTRPSEPTGGFSESKIRRATGEWTAGDIQNLAQSMIEETQFGDIVQTGQVLLDNLNGKTSFSDMSPLFTNDSLKIATVKSGRTRDGKQAPMTGTIGPIEPRSTVTLTPKSPGSTRFPTVSNFTRLRYESVTIGAEEMSGYSDFLFKFYMAKEIYNIKAFDMVAHHMVQPIFEDYVLSPDTDEAKRAIQLYGLRGGIAEMPARAIVDLWTHFLLVPAYLTATEQKRFSSGDLGNGGLAINVFKTPAELFQREGILTKNAEGRWEWTRDYDKFIQTWEDVALTGYRAGVISSPPPFLYNSFTA